MCSIIFNILCMFSFISGSHCLFWWLAKIFVMIVIWKYDFLWVALDKLNVLEYAETVYLFSVLKTRCYAISCVLCLMDVPSSAFMCTCHLHKFSCFTERLQWNLNKREKRIKEKRREEKSAASYNLVFFFFNN